MSHDKYKELSKNSLWTFCGNIGGKAIALIMLPFYTSILSVSDYGVLDIMTGYAITISEVVTMCISQAVFVFPKGCVLGLQKKYFTSGLLYSLIFAILLGLLGKIVIDLFMSNSNVFNSQYIYIYTIAISQFINNYAQNFIRSIGKMKVYGFVGIVYAVSTAIYSMVLMPQMGLIGYVLAIVFSNLSSAVYIIIAAELYRYFNFKSINWHCYKDMLLYASPLVLNVIISFMNNFLNRPFMEHYQSLENVGLYSVSSKFPAIISTMVPVFCLAAQISVMEEFGKDGYEKFYNNILKISTVILISGSIILIPLSKYLIQLFAAPEYFEAWIYMPLLLLSSIFNFWGYFSGTNFSAVKKSKYFLYSGILTVFVSISSNFIFIPYFGLWGVCCASLITGFAFCLTRLFFSWQYVEIRNIRHYLYQIIAFLFVMFICVHFDIDVISVLTGMITSIIILYKDRSMLPLIINKIKKDKNA